MRVIVSPIGGNWPTTHAEPAAQRTAHRCRGRWTAEPAGQCELTGERTTHDRPLGQQRRPIVPTRSRERVELTAHRTTQAGQHELTVQRTTHEPHPATIRDRPRPGAPTTPGESTTQRTTHAGPASSDQSTEAHPRRAVPNKPRR
jgi:hypothetical protein